MHTTTTTIFTLLALAATTLAAPAATSSLNDGLLVSRAEPDCIDATVSPKFTGNKSRCQSGANGLYCTGALEICRVTGLPDTYDARANTANENVCKALKVNDPCTQQASCCYE